MEFEAGDIVRIKKEAKGMMACNHSGLHALEFGNCIGVVSSREDKGIIEEKIDDLIKVRWKPSYLAYYYYRDQLELIKRETMENKTIPSIKEIVKDNVVNFSHLRKSTAYYNVAVDGVTYQFQVPLDDIGEGTLLPQDKAITFMRWIRKAIENNEFYPC